jgi:hypothetical protein
MTSWIAENDWSKVHVNDEVRVTRNGGMLTGKIVDRYQFSNGEIHAFALLVDGLLGSVHITHLVWSLFVPAKPAVVLPTEPGVYASHNDPPSPVIIHKLTHGDWVDAGDQNYLEDEEVMALMPLTLLEPVAVRAKKVLDRLLRYETSPGGYYKFQYTEDQLRSIFSEFGVRP